MNENNKTVSAPAKKADQGAPVANKKVNKNFVSRPKHWPHVDLKPVKKALGMLNDTEYKLMVLTCEDGQTTIDLISTLRDVNGKTEQNLYRMIFKLLWTIRYPGKPIPALNVEEHKDTKEPEYQNPTHINKPCEGTKIVYAADLNAKGVDVDDLVNPGYIKEAVAPASTEVSKDDLEEKEDPEFCKEEKVEVHEPYDPKTGKELGQEKTEEDIEDEAEEYKEYDDMMDDNAEKNARPSVKKSERFK